MNLELYTKNVYGVTRLYPACKMSIALTEIKGAPTLTNRDIETLARAGASITIYGKDGEVTKVGAA